MRGDLAPMSDPGGHRVRVFTFVRERMAFALRTLFSRHVNDLCLRFHGMHPSGELFNYLFGSPLAQIHGMMSDREMCWTVLCNGIIQSLYARRVL